MARRKKIHRSLSTLERKIKSGHITLAEIGVIRRLHNRLARVGGAKKRAVMHKKKSPAKRKTKRK